MSCKVEIIIEQHEEATYIPIQAVLRVGGRPTVYVLNHNNLESRTVEIGLDNNRMVRIISGLEPGEVVSLTPPLAAAAVEPTEYSDDIKKDTIPAKTEPQPSLETIGRGASQERRAVGGDIPRGRVDEEGPSQDASAARGDRGQRNLTPEQREKRRKFFESLSPEERKRFRNMSPEERRRFRQERMGSQ
jgi:hypothetical protein